MNAYSNKISSLCLSVLLATALSTPIQAQADGKDNTKWAASFAFSPQGNQMLRPPFSMPALSNQTLRSVVHLSLGGETIRVRITNKFGDTPLTVDAASVGLRAQGPNIVSGSLKTLTFGDSTSIIIPAGADAYSDPVDVSVADDSDLMINLFIAGDSPLPTIDDVSNKTSYISNTGDATGTEQMPAYSTVDVSYFTNGVDVLSHKKTKTIVTVGASLTDGYGADLDASNNYPSVLARRFLASKKHHNTSVVNAAISGNRLLTGASIFGPSTMERFDSDVLAQSGVTHILLEHGTNDIGLPEIAFILPEGDSAEPITADQLIAGMKQLIIKAHNRGIKIIGATLLPYKGAAYYTEEGNVKRQTLNDWMRTSNAFDGIVDFDAIMRDPSDPLQIRADLHIGDSLHPNSLGYQLMADSIDLDLFK